VQWWCAAQGIPWSWSWRAYPGVWLFIVLVTLIYLRGGRAREGEFSRQRLAFAAGILTLWAALDWPIGALGSGYLASVHMVQFVLIALVAPPLLLLGVPGPWFVRIADRRLLSAVLARLTHPLFALILFNVAVAVTHWPAVVDGLMASQLGSFAIDMAWLGSGILMWWPIVCPVPKRRFPYPLKIGYLLLNTVLNTAPYAFLTFGELPFYATYELAPRIGTISAQGDQRVAGLVMKLGSGVVFWTAIGILFYRWWRTEEAETTA